jgi:hypothetical protein
MRSRAVSGPAAFDRSDISLDVKVHAENQVALQDLAIDARYIYLGTDNAIMRVAR